MHRDVGLKVSGLLSVFMQPAEATLWSGSETKDCQWSLEQSLRRKQPQYYDTFPKLRKGILSHWEEARAWWAALGWRKSEGGDFGSCGC